MIGICWGWEYLNKGGVKEGELRRGWLEGEWYNHNDVVKRMSEGWKGRKGKGMWKEGRKEGMIGYQYHPEAKRESLKKMIKEIKKWRNEKRERCGVVIKRLKSAKEVAKTRKRAYGEWMRKRKNTRKNVGGWDLTSI